jgi:hypothetical protein
MMSKDDTMHWTHGAFVAFSSINAASAASAAELIRYTSAIVHAAASAEIGPRAKIAINAWRATMAVGSSARAV